MALRPASLRILFAAVSILAQPKVVQAERPSTGDQPIYLSGQAWSEEVRQRFYFTPQGSKIIPYDWAMALNNADDSLPFFSSANLKKYGYIPQAASDLNKDGLPVGFMKDESPAGFSRKEYLFGDVPDHSKMPQLGINCAACHTSELSYKGLKLRIDGGPSYSNFQAFVKEMDEAIARVSTNNLEGQANYAAFKAFADRYAKIAYNGQIPALKRLTFTFNLRKQLTAFNQERRTWETNNGLRRAGITYGPARNDAFGIIFNQTLGTFLNRPENILPPNAPVKYPVIWDAPYHDQVQWVGIARNNKDAGGPIARNIGQVLGVFGHSDVNNKSWIKGYCTSAKRAELNELEEWVRTLRSPTWPVQVFGFNPDMARKGQLHYQKYCLSCHELNERSPSEIAQHFQVFGISDITVSKPESQPMRKANEKMVNIDDPKLKTDPLTAFKAYDREAVTGPLEGRKLKVLAGRDLEKKEPGATLLRHVVAGSILGSFSNITCENTPLDSEANLGLAEKLLEGVLGFTKEDSDGPDLASRKAAFKEALNKYKARPLNGIWAAPPYLHNGSVRSLSQLLTPSATREQGFDFSCNEYDPVNVGLSCAPGQVTDQNRLFGSFAFKTKVKTKRGDQAIAGNSNQGHDYGTTELNDTEKLELIEYIKAL